MGASLKKIDKLRFGTAGIPISTPQPNTANGIGHVRKLGLEAMELEFVQSVNIKEEGAPAVKQAAEKNDVILTCHGQYFINLNAAEKAKLEASKHRVYTAAKRAWQCGGWSMCFHSAFYLGSDSRTTYEKVKVQLKEVVKKLKDEGADIWVRPETMGRQSQFGTMDEILGLSLEIENVMPCIDFSHLYAREIGKQNSIEFYSGILELVESKLGKEGLNNMHIHCQGIEFGDKGEKKHLPLSESKFDYEAVLKSLKEFKAKGVVICESPIMEEDAKVLLKTYEKL